MGAALLITFRETLEAVLVVGVIVAFLEKTGLGKLRSAVWGGALAGMLMSIIAALLFVKILGGFEGKAEQLFEAVVMLAGAGLLTSLILWLNKGDAKAAAEAKAATFAGLGGWWGIALLVFVSVLREGIETVLFIGSALKNPGAASLAGATAGIMLALILGFAFFRSGALMPLKGFFAVTNFLFILFAAGLAGRAVHELNEAGIAPAIIDHVWNINSPVNEGIYPLFHENGLIGGFLKSLFGYNGDPSLTEAAAYIAYLASIGGVLKSRKKQSRNYC
ncbi:MAG: FTR1 family iron permease [Spirochaetales bacterium]